VSRMLDYRIHHRTVYRYSEAVTFCQNLTHLTARGTPSQPEPQSYLRIHPEPEVIDRHTDGFGNPIEFFSLDEPHRELTLDVTHRIPLTPISLPDPAGTTSWELVRQELTAPRHAAALDARQFGFASRYVPLGAEYEQLALRAFTPHRPILEAALELTHQIYAQFTYDPRATTITTPVAEVLKLRRGVCQDFAHLQLAALRSIGLSARYVSGYLATKPPPGKERLVGADATHAWIAVYCGEAGWVGLDPTNDMAESERHIVLAWGRDYDEVSPVKGVILGGGQHTLHVTVDAVAV